MSRFESFEWPFHTHRSRIFQPFINSSSLSIYATITIYMERQLSFGGDRLQAMQGIFTAFQGRSVTPSRGSLGVFDCHFWGIPIFSNLEMPGLIERVSFGYGFPFDVTDACPEGPYSAFLSWSWASHEKPGEGITYGDYWHSGAFNNTIYEWSAPYILATTILGTRVDVENFTQLYRDYTQFLPHLEITSWSVWATFARYPHANYSEFTTDYGYVRGGCGAHESHGYCCLIASGIVLTMRVTGMGKGSLPCIFRLKKTPGRQERGTSRMSWLCDWAVCYWKKRARVPFVA
ncbi:hypothetical protein BU23DRAFT_635533 [Bimuria novae-zelandiae CBS 107.79]|uniref:Uncharacterized protein n=1 Tax=Bimuria novae-zelandiae CBS 107.79 TaxID=1447943 RepID=A0A6A5VCD4_9PLEO|nr:hypothetical protein BU23DRAFT_635533 [Bimuria novae-zelandiae CBS 107.79]